jgi:DNA relaxase NicK
MEDTYLPDDSYTLESAGVDWLTATAYRTSGRVPFKALGEDLIADEARQGQQVRTWRAAGYHGQQCGGVMYGARRDTWIIKLSSDVARERWREVRREATNVTRADVQITLRLKTSNANYFAEQRQRALASRRGRGRRANVTLISSSSDGDSLYLGKRSSNLYARVYDKGKEQKATRAGILIRQEVEAKAEAVEPLLAQLESSSSVEVECARVVSLYMERFAIQTIRGDSNFVWGARGVARRADAGCGWLRSAVAPTVLRLAECGRLQDALDALGIAELVSVKAGESER